MMQRMRKFCLPALLILVSGCTNALYTGELTTLDAYDKERQFVLYWTRTDPLIGRTKAGPAILLTECSLTRIDFSDQEEGIVFRGMPGEDRLAGMTETVSPDQVCGMITSYPALREAQSGPAEVRIDCEPMPPDEFDLRRRNYLPVSPPPHRFEMIEARREWSFFGKTLEGPSPPDCREP